MSTVHLDVDEYRALLSDALPSAQDADTIRPSITSLFTPDRHRRALDVDATVVRGGRGVGKTVWCRSLLNDDLRRLAAAEYNIDRLNRVQVSAGFGADLEPDRYPGPSELRQLIDSGAEAYQLWNAVLLVALKHPGISAAAGWSARLDWLRDNPGERDRWIARADQEAQASATTQLILFDALEHLHSERRLADLWVGGILQLALDLRLRTKAIRFKIFIRPDMLEGADLHFPDASKLVSNAADLKWSTANLYGLFFHYLGNSELPAAEKFRTATPGWREPASGRHLPPESLVREAETQAAEFRKIAGPYMGANYRKGITYTWLPNHLMDGTEQVSPRSFMVALFAAVQDTIENRPSSTYPIFHEGIRRGVQVASKTRVTEIREDLPWVGTAVELLAGQQVPIEESAVVDLWEKRGLSQLFREEAVRMSRSDEDELRTGPRYPDNYSRLIGELIELGVMQRRKDGRLDLPDVYRIAFSIGRKGGVPKA
ncbi:hypothetical protein [Nocardia sp. BMG111209]|uniref:hypothetical protein n=1 Tax=Nocardia sp. BMG111209 TaxID=1160137 RepID=UPI00035C7225|nr:hypothetical protein [Nocardia sp. BMG111209]